ncbi:hypothetical protein CTheo_5922 [Ceratobasidium theobromae]|uniref:Uncharacterized protein n=1 Tax=Ceratobasidium theobromae TaxID=1582974 RepID=A0A5N5QGQ9_9AGAM|nr:hypothetical protein CTheo_5922 [Ceratobasidium theobromae]
MTDYQTQRLSTQSIIGRNKTVWIQTPMALQKDGHVRVSMDEALSPGTPSVSASPSLRPAVGMESPRLDLGEDFTRTDSLDVDQRSLARATTGKFTIAFGRDSSSNPGSSATNRSNTKASGRSKHSRNASHLTRSSTIRTERTDITDASSPISTVSGQIMAVLTGRISTPLLRSMNSLRRAATEAPNEAAADSPGSAGSGTETPVRRLPPVPAVPPVPPLPKQYTSTPRPLPIPNPSQAASLTIDAGEFSELIPRTIPARSASTPASPPIRPLPVPPATVPQ